MRISTFIIAIIASLLAAFVLQYGFNNLVTDIINYRNISFFESFVIVEILALISLTGSFKNFKKDETEPEDLIYNIFYKVVGYLVFLVIFFILILIKNQ